MKVVLRILAGCFGLLSALAFYDAAANLLEGVPAGTPTAMALAPLIALPLCITIAAVLNALARACSHLMI